MTTKQKKIGTIEKKLIGNRNKGKKSLIAFINAGDPDLHTTKQIIEILDSHHLDILELGVPFPDSFTDGEVIVRSHERAIKAGATLEGVLEMVKTLRKTCKIPMVLMSEFSHTVKPYGLKKYLALCKDAQIDGVLLHCLPPAFVEEYRHWASVYELETIFSFFPKTKKEKRDAIYDTAQGFIYLVSNYGKTGKGNAFSDTTIAYLKKIRQETDAALAVGFGVKGPRELKVVYESGMDAAIVGSAFISAVESAGNQTSQVYEKVDLLVQQLMQEKEKYTCEV